VEAAPRPPTVARAPKPPAASLAQVRVPPENRPSTPRPSLRNCSPGPSSVPCCRGRPGRALDRQADAFPLLKIGAPNYHFCVAKMKFDAPACPPVPCLPTARRSLSMRRQPGITTSPPRCCRAHGRMFAGWPVTLGGEDHDANICGFGPTHGKCACEPSPDLSHSSGVPAAPPGSPMGS